MRAPPLEGDSKEASAEAGVALFDVIYLIVPLIGGVQHYRVDVGEVVRCLRDAGSTFDRGIGPTALLSPGRDWQSLSMSQNSFVIRNFDLVATLEPQPNKPRLSTLSHHYYSTTAMYPPTHTSRIRPLFSDRLCQDVEGYLA